MKIPARCNKRSCQARRNLSKRPEEYVRHPLCHLSSCGGLMYVDEYRLRKGQHDHPPVCHMDCYHFPHGVSSANCKQREEFIIDQSMKPISKHSPKKTSGVPF